MDTSRILDIILYAIGILLAYQILIRLVRKLIRFPAPAFIGYFLDSDLRRWMQPASDFIAGAGIQSGMRVLEIGCGSGGLTLHVARAVGPKGTVEALDIQPRMLAQLEKKLKNKDNQDIVNIHLHLGNAYELPFGDEELDLVYLITVLQEIPDRSRALAEIRRVLKKEGILAVSELLLDPDYVLQSTTIREGQQAGFDLQGIRGNFWTYTARFIKPL